MGRAFSPTSRSPMRIPVQPPARASKGQHGSAPTTNRQLVTDANPFQNVGVAIKDVPGLRCTWCCSGARNRLLVISNSKGIALDLMRRFLIFPLKDTHVAHGVALVHGCDNAGQCWTAYYGAAHNDA